MRNTKWLLITGVIVGSLLLTGFAFWMQPAFMKAAHHSDSSSAHQQSEINQSALICRQNPAMQDTVRQWCDTMVDQAYDHQLDPYLLAAIITVESDGNADALSGSGAVGLMQVMPRDGTASQFTCVNGPCFAKRPSMAELYDPAFNIQYGSSLLAGLIARYNGDIREALKSYGPHDIGYAYADMVLGVYNSIQE